MKQFNKAISLIIILTLSIGMIFTLCACEPEPPDPVYEIRLYDDDWQELEKHYYGDPKDNNYYYSAKIYEYKYDGERKGFNARAYKDGVKFYELNYLDYNYKDLIAVSRLGAGENWETGGYLTDWPIDKGCYVFEYHFTMHQRTYYDTPIGTISCPNDLPTYLELEHRIRIKIE